METFEVIRHGRGTIRCATAAGFAVLSLKRVQIPSHSRPSEGAA